MKVVKADASATTTHARPGADAAVNRDPRAFGDFKGGNALTDGACAHGGFLECDFHNYLLDGRYYVVERAGQSRASRNCQCFNTLILGGLATRRAKRGCANIQPCHIFQFEGYRFFFFSNEGSPREPVHVHIRKDGNRAKFWLYPVCLANNQGHTGKELNKLAQIVEAREDEIERAWHEHFGN